MTVLFLAGLLTFLSQKQIDMLNGKLDKIQKQEMDNDFSSTKFNDKLIKDFNFTATFKIELLDLSDEMHKKLKEDPEYKNVDIWDGDLMGKYSINYDKLSRYVNIQFKQRSRKEGRYKYVAT
jgi:hypothetical protein